MSCASKNQKFYYLLVYILLILNNKKLQNIDFADYGSLQHLRGCRFVSLVFTRKESSRDEVSIQHHSQHAGAGIVNYPIRGN